MDKLDEFIARRKENFRFLRQLLSQYEDRLVLPVVSKHSDPAWFCFLITVREKATFGRLELTRHLEDNGIETRPLFGGNLLRHPAFIDIPRRIVGNLQNTDLTDLIMKNTSFIGVYPAIGKSDLERIKFAFEDFMQ